MLRQPDFGAFDLSSVRSSPAAVGDTGLAEAIRRPARLAARYSCAEAEPERVDGPEGAIVTSVTAGVKLRSRR
jgi:hypothetical protein